jgi:hypothetical protein
VPGGSAATGTIDSTGRYMAPAAATNVTVEATSIAQPTAREIAHVTITTNVVTVTVSPNTANVARGTTLQFTAPVSGTSDQRVQWRVGGVPGGNSTVGSITTTGLYTAPPVPPATQPVVVTAWSVAAPGIGGSARVTVQ